jgi:hypothetical protein
MLNAAAQQLLMNMNQSQPNLRRGCLDLYNCLQLLKVTESVMSVCVTDGIPWRDWRDFVKETTRRVMKAVMTNDLAMVFCWMGQGEKHSFCVLLTSAVVEGNFLL